MDIFLRGISIFQKNDFSVEDAPFKTDHKIVKMLFEFKTEKLERPQQRYTPKDSNFEDNKFLLKLQKEIDLILEKINLTNGKKLELI